MTRVASFCALAAPFSLLALTTSAPASAQQAPSPPPVAPAPPAQAPAPPAQAPAPPAQAPAQSAATVPPSPADFGQPIPYPPTSPRAFDDSGDEEPAAAPRRKRRKGATLSRPGKLAWEPGEAIPPGYHPDDGPNKRFLVGGISTFGGFYLASIVGGLIAASGGDGDQLSPLFIPLAGPFVAIGTADASRSGAYVLAMDGLGQLVGGTFFMLAFLDKDHWLQRDDADAPQISVGPRGVHLRMEF